MENKNSYFIAGLIFVIFSFGALIFILFMNGYKNDYADEYFIQTDELPRGIKKGGAVYFVGVNAGIIKDVYFLDTSSAKVEIAILMQKGLPISANSLAQVETAGISGVSFINISRGDGLAFSQKKRIIQIKQAGLAQIESNVLSISQKLDLTLTHINEILGDGNTSGLWGFLNQIASKQNADNLSEILINAKDFSANLKNLELNQTINNLNALSTDIQKSAHTFNALANALNARLERGEFNYKAILMDTSDDLALTNAQLRATLKQISQALIRLERDPYGFFFNSPKKDKK